MPTAGDLMSRELFMIEASATVADASRTMNQHHLHSLIVDRCDGLDSYGILTSTDVIRKVLAHGHDPARVMVQTVMSKPIITIPPDCSLLQIAMLMERHHINHLPVFDGRRLVGMVSSTDIFNVRQE